MQSFLTYSDMKNKPIRAKIRLSRTGTIVFAVVLALVVALGGNALLQKSNDQKMRDISQDVVTNLINSGSYAGIKKYTSSSFLGELKESDYNASASSLTSLKGSKVSALNEANNTVFGTITPNNITKDGEYLFGYTVTFKKSGLNGFKVTNIVTDYGRDSFFTPN